MSKTFKDALIRGTLGSLTLLALACGSDGSDGEPGPAGSPGARGKEGPQGPSGPPGSNGGLVWKDATGKIVGTYVLVNYPLGYGLFDSNGFIWSVMPFGTKPIGSFRDLIPLYKSNTCTGPLYVATLAAEALLPRFVARRPDGRYATLIDTAKPLMDPVFYILNKPGDCMAIGVTHLSVHPDADLSDVTDMPTATAPMHIEAVR